MSSPVTDLRLRLAIQALINQGWSRDDVVAYLAMQNGEAEKYLIGTPRPDPLAVFAAGVLAGGDVGDEMAVGKEYVAQVATGSKAPRVKSSGHVYHSPEHICKICGKETPGVNYSRCAHCARTDKREVITSRKTGRTWTAEDLILAVQAHVEEFGMPPRSKDWLVEVKDHPSAMVIIGHLGGWNVLIRAAGFKPHKPDWQPGKGEKIKCAPKSPKMLELLDTIAAHEDNLREEDNGEDGIF